MNDKQFLHTDGQSVFTITEIDFPKEPPYSVMDEMYAGAARDTYQSELATALREKSVRCCNVEFFNEVGLTDKKFSAIAIQNEDPAKGLLIRAVVGQLYELPKSYRVEYKQQDCTNDWCFLQNKCSASFMGDASKCESHRVATILPVEPPRENEHEKQSLITTSQNVISCLAELTHGIVNGRVKEKNITAFRNACDQFEMLKDTASRELYAPRPAKEEGQEELWVKSEIQLPERDTTVLCILRIPMFSNMVVNSWSPATDQDEEWFREAFVYWQPLPPAPKTLAG